MICTRKPAGLETPPVYLRGFDVRLASGDMPVQILVGEYLRSLTLAGTPRRLLT